jgi:hypothetical protein
MLPERGQIMAGAVMLLLRARIPLFDRRSGFMALLAGRI